MEIEKDQEASGMKDVAEGAAAQEPEKEPEAGEEVKSQEAEPEEAGEEAEAAPPEGEDPRTWAEKRAAKKQAKLDKKAQGYKDQIDQLRAR